MEDHVALYEKESYIEKLNEKIQDCSKCSSLEIVGQAVPFEGDPMADVIVVGNTPGLMEDAEKRPFAGRNEECLDEFLEKARLSRNSVMLANVICCYSSYDNPPKEEEVSRCIDYLKELIGIIRPRIIVTLGKQPLQVLVNTHDSPTRSHGTVYDAVYRTPYGIVETKVISTWHPGSVLRDDRVREEFMDDAGKLRDWLEG